MPSLCSRASALIAVLLAAEAAAGPRFVERAADLGINHHYIGGWEHFVGGGVAAFDCDGDDLLEIYAAGGEGPPVFLRNRSTADSLIFEEEMNLAITLQGVTGAYPLDIDADGHADLVILRAGRNEVMKGGPDCSFAPFTDLKIDAGDRWSTAFSATWEAGESLPTLAFGNYVNRDDPNGPFEACDVNHLMQPEGDAYGQAQQLAPGFCALSMLFSDWGRTGRADLRISNDRHYYVRGGAEQLWAMEATPRPYTQADGWRRLPIWGMGIASRDINRDGAPDVYLTSMGDQKLQYQLPGGPIFENAPFETGATAHRPYVGDDGRPSTGWHAEFGDVDNDGLDDLFVAKGNVEQMPSNAMEDPNNLLMQRADGRFVEAGTDAGLASMARGRGAVLTDLNNDGLLDLVVVNRSAPMEIYQNVTPDTGGWLLVDVLQTGPNRDAVGAWIEVEAGGVTQHREITVGGGHVSGWLGPQHFGLGAAETARVRVIWPGGEVGAWRDVDANTRIEVKR